MNRRQKIIVSVTGIFLVLLLLVGLTYAYFLTRVTGNTKDESISVTTADLKLVYGDGNGEITSVNKIIPGQPIEFGNGTNSKIFTVSNEGTKATNYAAIIENVLVTWASDGTTEDEEGNQITYTEGQATKFKTNDFTYTLDCKVYSKEEYSSYDVDDPTTHTSTVPCNSVNKEATFPINGGIMVENSIDKDVVHVYEFKMKYNDSGEDQSLDMNKTLTARINITDSNNFNPYSDNKASLAYNIINNAINPSEEDITNGFAQFTLNLATQPAEAISGENESILSTTLDDLGTSYYFRGNVKNNYVEFNNMCWRIVRIEGDGSVKLTLAAQKACSAITGEDTGSAFIGTGVYGTKEKYYISETMGEISYSGLAYVISNNQTTAKEMYSEWADGTLDDGSTPRFSDTNKEKIKTTTICIGDIESLYKESGELVDKEFLITDGTGLAKLNFNFANKLAQKNITSLECDDNNSRTSEGQIFPLTAGEVLFAGGGIGANSKYYLYENSNSGEWLTITPSYFYKKAQTNGEGYDYYERHYTVKTTGDFNAAVPGSTEKKVRPAISLIAGTEIVAGGNGTITNPYVIQ